MRLPLWLNRRLHLQAFLLFPISLCFSLLCLILSMPAILVADEMGDLPMLTAADDPTMNILVGTYTNGGSQGVYRLSLNLETGELIPLGLVAQLDQPSFLAAAAGLPDHFVAVHETGQFKGQPGGGLSLLKFKAADGTATVIADRGTLGGAPCHVVINPAGSRIAVANYTGGSYIGYRLMVQPEPDGQASKDPPVDDGWLSRGNLFQNKGSSNHPQRQQAPHGHCVRFLPGNDSRIVARSRGTLWPFGRMCWSP